VLEVNLNRLPSALKLTHYRRIKVLDFGLARPVSEGADGNMTPPPATEAGRMMGTLGYMSPDQVRAERLDARSDVFSLGVVLRELLAAEHPFRRETTAATLAAILHETPPPLDAPGLPPGTEAVASRCLEKRREDRFSSGEPFARPHRDPSRTVDRRWTGEDGRPFGDPTTSWTGRSTPRATGSSRCRGVAS